MKLNQEFIKAVEEHDALLVRIMLKDSLIVDPTFVEFDFMLEFAKQSILELFDDHDSEVFKSDKTEWNKEYLNSQMVQVIRNFSKERITLLREMCRFLYEDRAKKIEEDRNSQKNKSDIPVRKVGTSLTIGGVALAVIGVAISKPVIIVTGAIVAVTGGVVIFADRRGND